ncbi:MAG: methyl-accepting chemotaxis protein, partial [Gammaproteobacteria bacterium]|nr:methyl-accepting chemotaxis protein [Gammaproteobacteria bacterium]
MNLGQPEIVATTSLRGRLPLKITGIVFWGMMLVGLIFSLIQLRNLEDQVMGRFSLNADRFIATVNDYLEVHPQLDPDVVDEQLQRLLGKHEFSGAILIIRDHTYRIGATPRGDRYADTAILDEALGRDGQALERALFYQTNLQAIMDAKRKELLVTMGALSLVFGLILQWILQRVLTRPFLRMVNTAERFASGMTEARFDERRHDEFGFLGKFFNKALSYLLQQQDELRD